MDGITLPPLDVDVPPQGLTIGEVAYATGLKISTLRFYEREGLMLDPTPRDVSGRRRYDEHDLAWIGGLIMLRATGMSVADMRALADLSREHGTEGERLSILQAHRERVLEAMERTRRHLEALDSKIDAYREVVASRARKTHAEGEDS